jgi:malate dehydrogenase (oxaloacetate-decarboxylating)
MKMKKKVIAKPAYKEAAITLHKKLRGKIAVVSKSPVTKDTLGLLYTPGVAEPCRQIAVKKELVYDYTSRHNMIAVISDGSAVLGLGNIGPEAGLPVMEGKAILFKTFGGVDAFPICLATQDTEEIIKTVKYLAPSFGGINLEDISAPRCFEVEKRLIAETDIPIFHDDQHGTAVVVLAGLINVFKMDKRKINNVRIVINGAGAAGVAIAKFLLKYGFKNIILCDRHGAIYEGRGEGMNPIKEEMVKFTNLDKKIGELKEVIKGTDIFLGVSAADAVTIEMVRSMAKDPIIFAMANPDPEILPAAAKSGGAKYIATGRSDFANQINNVLAFPGIFRGTLDVRAGMINDEMKIAASLAISSLIPDNKLTPEYFIPKAYDMRIAPKVARAVAEEAIRTEVARIRKSGAQVEKDAKKLLGVGVK